MLQRNNHLDIEVFPLTNTLHLVFIANNLGSRKCFICNDIVVCMYNIVGNIFMNTKQQCTCCSSCANKIFHWYEQLKKETPTKEQPKDFQGLREIDLTS